MTIINDIIEKINSSKDSLVLIHKTVDGDNQVSLLRHSNDITYSPISDDDINRDDAPGYSISAFSGIDVEYLGKSVIIETRSDMDFYLHPDSIDSGAENSVSVKVGSKDIKNYFKNHTHLLVSDDVKTAFSDMIDLTDCLN